MREKIIRYEAAGRGILSIKDAFYLTGSSSPPVIHLLCSLLPLFRGTLLLLSLSLSFSLFFCFSPCCNSSHPAQATQTRRSNSSSSSNSSLLPRVTQRLFLPAALPLFLHSHRFTKGARNWKLARMSRDVTNHLTISARDSSSSVVIIVVLGEVQGLVVSKKWKF